MKKVFCGVMCIVSLFLGNMLYRNILMIYVSWLFKKDGNTNYMFLNFACFCIFETVMIIIVIWCFYNRKQSKTLRGLYGFLFLNYIIILICCLYPGSYSSRHVLSELNIMDSIDYYITVGREYYILGKTITFIPLGILINSIKPMKTVLARVMRAVAVAMYVEILQFVTINGYFETLDVIMYSFGIALGELMNKRIINFKWNAGEKETVN